MGLVQVINKINRVTNPIEKYQHLFNGIGKLKNKTVKLHINKDVKPVALRHRRTPFHLRDKVKAEIKRLVDEDIIEKVENSMDIDDSHPTEEWRSRNPSMRRHERTKQGNSKRTPYHANLG